MLSILGLKPIKILNQIKRCVHWSAPVCTDVSLSSYLTRVKMNVSMFAAVAAVCGSHQCSGV